MIVVNKDFKIIGEVNEKVYEKKEGDIILSGHDWLVEVEGLGVITAKKYDEMTDRKNKDWEKNQKLKMDKLTKHDMIFEDGKLKAKPEYKYKFNKETL